MSNDEVERIMAERPPSSYGSMCSDDPEEDDEIQGTVPQPIIKVNLNTRIKLHRPDSPETAITSITGDTRTDAENRGVYITASREEQVPRQVTMEEDDDDETYVLVEDPRIEEEISVPVDPSLPEPSHTLMGITAESDNQLELPFIFRGMLECLRSLNVLELQCFVRTLCSQRKGELEFRQLEQEGELDVLGVVDRILEKWDRGEALHITKRALYDINKCAVANQLESTCRRALVQFELRANHRRHYHSLYEGTCRPGQQRYIRHVYVESPVVLETQTDEGTPIRMSDLFSSREGEDRVRIVVTTGVPAVGLTATVQMFIMDWTEEKAYQDFQYVFALPGRDLHLVKNPKQTFLQFLAAFYPEAKHAEFLALPDCAVLFVIDALELCRQPLDFQNNPNVTEITAEASVDALLTSLMKGDLLPHACIWITAHRPAFRKIPENVINRFTELKGFNDTQKDKYFTKRTKDKTLGPRVLDRVKGSLGLYDACYLPLFSWIVSFVYERHLQNKGFAEPVPSLTTFYTQYIIVLMNRKIERYFGTGLEASRWKDPDKDFLMKMGMLALRMLREGRTVFYEDSISQLALDIHDVTHRCGISSETCEPTPENERSFRFVHHSIQKFMAALYVYVTFRMTGDNILDSQTGRTKIERPVSELYKPTIDHVLARNDEDMDLFLHFLLGLSARKTEMHLRGHLLPHYQAEPKGVEDALKYAIKKIKENIVPERCRNLQLCITELEEGRNL